jgi:type III restriction enzyme
MRPAAPSWPSARAPIITEKYADYLNLGVEEWRKSYAEHEKLGKKAVLFVMTDDTKNCDDVGAYLEGSAPTCRRGAGDPHQEQRRDFRSGVRQEPRKNWKLLRKQANEIDTWKSPTRRLSRC